VPAAHKSQLAWSLPSWYWPDGQWPQLSAPVKFANLPSLQDAQAAPVVAWNCPTAHSVHAVAGAVEYWPFEHVVHDCALYVVLIWPCGQATQVVVGGGVGDGVDAAMHLQ